MSDLNDSVIFCGTLSSGTNQQKTTSPKQKKQKKKKKQETIRTCRKTFYESPLRHIQLSGKRWEQQTKAKQKVNNNKDKQLKNNENKFFSNIDTDSWCQDSVIILSDNECEFDDTKDKHVCETQEETGKRSVKRLDNNLNGLLKPKKSPVLICSRKRKSIFISDTEDSDTDNENIVPSDSVNHDADDIVVMWSSKSTATSDMQTTESNIVNVGTTKDNLINLEKHLVETVNLERRNKEGKPKETVVNQKKHKGKPEEGEITDRRNKAERTIVTQAEDNRLFMIDRSPDPKNLHCLITERRNKRNANNDREKKAQTNDDTDSIFNKFGLKLPYAQNISSSITMEKPKSGFKVLLKSKSRLSRFDQMYRQPSTSSIQNQLKLPSNDISLGSVLSGSVTFPCNGLREIVIDGNNVAMAHTNGKSFSEKGLMIVIDYFKSRGHLVKVFVPQYRRSSSLPLLEKWYKQGIVVFTPSRHIAGKWITPYDDRYIIEYATMCKGIVISMDQFRDLYNEKPEWRDTIMNRLLTPTFVGDIVMFPEDPLGRTGPRLERFLKH